jgi:ABC-type nitrate/sulfonate/bicarbonate transport system permease component
MARTRAHHGRLAGATIATAKLFAAIAFGLLVWEVLIKTSGLDSYFVKSPADVWRYLFTSGDSAANRHTLLTNLGQTARDAGFGWVAGTAVAILTAFVLILLPPVGAAVMPFVIVLRSVPLIAMCPLLGLVFGRGLAGVTVIAGLVTFVPSLVTIVGGLRTAPSAATDLVYCGGGNTISTLLKVRAPFAMPEFFAAAKISMPGAVLGSVLAEWLITAHGLGYAMAYDIISSNYNELFASIAALLAISLGLYAIVGAIESLVRDRIRGS